MHYLLQGLSEREFQFLSLLSSFSTLRVGRWGRLSFFRLRLGNGVRKKTHLGGFRFGKSRVDTEKTMY